MTPDQPVEDEPTGEEDGTRERSDRWDGHLGTDGDVGSDGELESGDAGPSDDDFGSDGGAPPAAFPMPGLSGALSRGVVGGLGQSQVILEPKSSTPFDVAESGHGVPASALWAMKYLRHGRYGLSSGDGPDRIRWASDQDGDADRGADAVSTATADGTGTDYDAGGGTDDPVHAGGSATAEDAGGPVYVIDDGPDHCMVARLVGASPDGCIYCLVARIKRPDFDDLRAGWAKAADLFTHGKEFTLCGVVEGSVSNVVRVGGYRRYKHVPVEYLPPAPFIEFDEAI